MTWACSWLFKVKAGQCWVPMDPVTPLLFNIWDLSGAPSDVGLLPCTPDMLKPGFKPIHKQGVLTSLRIVALS